MGTGYIRKDTGNNIADGNVINASDLDGEFDGLVSAFATSTGHSHDGTEGEGGPVSKIGPSLQYEADANAFFPETNNAVDLGKTAKQFKDLYIDGVINADSVLADAVTVTNALSAESTLKVGGAATLESTLAVSADSSLKGAVSVETTLRVTGDTDVEDLSASGTFDVAGTTNLATAVITGTVNIVGETTLDDISASGTLDVAGTTNLATASITGTVNVTGDTTLDNVTASGTLNVAGETNLATATITGNVSADGTLNISGNGSVGGTFNVEGDLKNSAGNLTIAATSYIVEVKGGGSTDAELKLNCRSNSHGQTIKSQEHSAEVTNTMLLPKGANSTLVSEVGTATLTNKTLDSAVSVSAAGVVNVGTNLSVLGNAEVGGTFKITSTVSAEAALNVGGLLNVTGSAGLAGNVNLGNATADSVVVGGVLTANASANLTGNVGVGGTITGSSTISDGDGNLRDIPVSQNLSGNYTLAIGDVGNQITINTSNAIVTVPGNDTFGVGDIISLISVNGCTATIACTAVNAVKAGDLAATALHTLDANGVASIMFTYTANLAVLTGNIS